MMDENQIVDYKKNGYCILKNLIPLKRSKQLLRDIHSIARFQLGRFKQLNPSDELGEEQTLANDMQELLLIDVNAYLGFARRCAKLVNLHRYLSHDSIISTLNCLDFKLPTIVTEPVMHINSDKLIIPNGYAGFETHQDWPSIQGSIDCLVVWAPLVKVTEVNFPLQVLPGSHKHGLYKGTIEKNLLKIDKSLYDASRYVSIEASAGDIVLMSSWTLHQTGMLDSQGFRLACSTRYDNSAEQHFIERSYPCAYQRTVNREMITPNFPTHKQVANLFS